MKDESGEAKLNVGEFVDLEVGSMWVPRVVTAIEETTAGRTAWLKDPRPHAIALESVNLRSERLRPFRSRSVLKPLLVGPVFGLKLRELPLAELERRADELEELAAQPLSRSPQQIVQFLRGRHYFFADDLTAALLDPPALATVLRYLAAARAFLPAFLRALDFAQAEHDIYASPMSALCSAFGEVLEFSGVAAGTAREFEGVRGVLIKEEELGGFQREVAEWAEKEVLDALRESRHEGFPPGMLFAVFALLHSVFSRVVSVRSLRLPDIYEMLYEDLKRALRYPLDLRDLTNFEKICEGIFKSFRCPAIPDSSSASSPTEQIDLEAPGASPSSPVSPTSPTRERDPVWENAQREEFAKVKKMEYRYCLAQAFLKREENERFLQEVLAMVGEGGRTINANGQLPGHLRYLIDRMEEGLLEQVIELNFQFENATQKNIVFRVYGFAHDETLRLLVKYERLFILKHLLQLPGRSAGLIEKIVDQVIQNAPATIHPKDYFEFFNHIDRISRTPHLQLESLRPKLMSASFRLATALNDHKFQIEGLFEGNDRVREDCWKAYTEQHILPLVNSHPYSYFFEASIHRYTLKHRVDLATFTALCQFMTLQAPHEDLYNKRKTSLAAALSYIYSQERNEYPLYLSAFLHCFCHANHEKAKHDWHSLLAFPADVKSFLSLPLDVRYCTAHLGLLSPLHYEIDIQIFLKLLLKLNSLIGSVTLNPDESIARITQVPAYFEQLLRNFMRDLGNVRVKLIEKEIERYFHGAIASGYEDTYNLMLLELLRQILERKTIRPDMNFLFRRLKTRNHLIPKVQPQLNGVAAEETIICRNVRIIERCDNSFEDLLFEPILNEYRKKGREKVMLSRSEPVRVLKARLALKLSREPADILLLLDGEPLPLLAYSQPFSEVFEIVERQTQIDFQINPTPPPARAATLQSFPELFNLLPTTSAFLRGVDLIEQDWNRVESLFLAREVFKGMLVRGEAEEELRVSSKLDVVLEFCLWKLEERRDYDFTPLVRLLRPIDSEETVLRNYKIVYLARECERPLSHEDCSLVLASLLPDLHPDKKDKSLQFIKGNENYELLMKLVEGLVERAADSLTFVSTFAHYQEFTNIEALDGFYIDLWSKIYANSSTSQKADFFRNFQHLVASHPDNLKDLYMVITTEDLTNNLPFYQQVVAGFVALLVSLDRRSLTLNQLKTIEILILNISQLCEQSEELQPLLQVRGLVDFVESLIYQLSEKAQAELLKIVKMIASNDENRLSLLHFFKRETEEKAWLSQSHVVRTGQRTLQLQGRVGLKNPEFVCYANSLLQQLYHIEMFRDGLFATPYTPNPSLKEDLIYQMKKLFLHLHHGNEPYLNLHFFTAFKTEGEDTRTDVQMDVDEFRNLLFDQMENCLPRDHFIKKVFYGKLNTVIKCQENEHAPNLREEDFTGLNIEVKDFTNLHASLDNYFKPELMQDENAYNCETCRKKVTAQKSIEISSLPPYLTFILKRFEYLDTQQRVKLNSYFEFPLEALEYFPGKKYRLKGVIVHSGVSDAGHYISFAKHNEVWYEFNDSNVSEVNLQTIREFAFGKPTPADDYIPEQSKNAYIIIYEAEDAPRTPESERKFIGIEEEQRSIVRSQQLSIKERIYFSSKYLDMVNHMVLHYGGKESLHLLFWNIMTIYARGRLDPAKSEELRTGLSLLKASCSSLDGLWLDNEFERVLELLTSWVSVELKSILASILVGSCQQYDARVERVLSVCLGKMYQEGSSGYYILMHWMARRFDEACHYLNSERIVGRILDLLLITISPLEARDALKATCSLPFEDPFTSIATLKDAQKSYFKYHRWALVTTVLNKTGCKLHEVERQYFLFNPNNLYLELLFEEASAKPTAKYVSSYLSTLCSASYEFFGRLLNFLGEHMRHKEDSRRYLKAIKECLSIVDPRSGERSKNAAIIFQRQLKKLLEEKKENQFLYAWQWFILTARTNPFFRDTINQYKDLFSAFSAFTPSALHANQANQASPSSIYLTKRAPSVAFKIHFTKHPLYGIIGPTSLRELDELVARKRREIAELLEVDSQVFEVVDEEGDITNHIFESREVILKFDEARLKFTRATVTLAIGDLLILQITDRSDRDRPKEGGNFVVFMRGDERLRLRTAGFPNMLLIDADDERMDVESSSAASPRKI